MSDPKAAARPGVRARVEAALAGLPPSTDELAVAMVAGAVAVALANAVAITAGVPWPGLGLRLGHHLFDALELCGLGACLALVTLVAGRLPLPRWLGWIAFAALASVAAHGLLEVELTRQADAILDGLAPRVLYPLFIGLVGAGIVIAHLLGALCARAGKGAIAAGVVLVLGGLCACQLIQRDDHPGMHAGLTWGALALSGSLAAPRFSAALARRPRAFALALALFAALALGLAPPNGVRLQLFRQPGAAAPWVLARTVWRLPSLPPAAPPPFTPMTAGDVALDRDGLAGEPVVVLLTIDALRADVLADRHNDARFPRLARLRDKGAWFPRASAAGAQTSVSLTSMFTSRYYSQLLWRAYGNGKTRFLYAAEDPAPRFPELLDRAGIRSESYLGLVFLADEFGVARGFSAENRSVLDRSHATAAQVLSPLIARLKRVRGRAFFYAHLMEPHEPYDRGGLRDGSDWERYLSEIELCDRRIGELVSILERRLRGRGYLIVSSDHGEAFGEHGTKFHTKTLYQELVHVPLIVWGPGIDAKTVQARVSLLDLGPTVMHLFGLPPPEGAMGWSLLPLASGRLDDLPRPVMAEGRLRRAYWSGDLKVIEDGLRKTVEVYDLAADPGETHNLFDADRARVEPAVAALRAFFAEHTRRDPPGYEPPYKP